MKNWMKVSVFMAMSLVNYVYAQENAERQPRTPEQRSEIMTNKMEKELTLTTEQKEKVKSFNLEAAKLHEELKNKKDLKPEERKIQFKAIEDKRIANIKSVLNTTQNAKFDALINERTEKIEERKEAKKEDKKDDHKEPKTAEERSTHLTDKMVKELNLSEEQKQKVAVINLQAAKDHDALKNNKEIKEEDRKQLFKKIEQKRIADIKPLLNAEQLKKFEAFLKEKKENHKEKKK